MDEWGSVQLNLKKTSFDELCGSVIYASQKRNGNINRPTNKMVNGVVGQAHCSMR